LTAAFRSVTMFFLALLHLYLLPAAFWPFGSGARAQTKPAPSTATMIFGFLALVGTLVGASIGAKHFVDYQTAESDASAHPITLVLGPLSYIVSQYEAALKAIGFPVETYVPTTGLAETDDFVTKFYALFLKGIHEKFVENVPKPAGVEGALTDGQAEFQLLKHTALVAALAIVCSWTVMALDHISSDKGVLNPVRKFADGALSVLTAASSLLGSVLLTALYTFDAFFLFSAGHLVMFNYPWVFRLAGVVMAAAALGYVYWIGTFSKSLWEMHTFGLTIACAISLNSVLFYVVCESADAQLRDISGSCWKLRGDAGWSDNFNVLLWEPSFVLFLMFLKSFVHASAALGSSLSDRIDGGPDTYFKGGVANLYQVKAAMFDSFDVIVRALPIALLYSGVAATDEKSPAVSMVNLIDDYYRSNIVATVLAILATVFSWVFAAFVFVISTVKTLRDLLLTDPELTMFVAILYVSTKIAFGSDNEDRYNPLGDITKYFNTAVATVQEAVPVLSAKKDKSAASPKAAAAPRAGSAKRK